MPDVITLFSICSRIILRKQLSIRTEIHVIAAHTIMQKNCGINFITSLLLLISWIAKITKINFGILLGNFLFHGKSCVTIAIFSLEILHTLYIISSTANEHFFNDAYKHANVTTLKLLNMHQYILETILTAKLIKRGYTTG